MVNASVTRVVKFIRKGERGNSVITADTPLRYFRLEKWQQIGSDNYSYSWANVYNASDFKVGDTIVVNGIVTDKDGISVMYYGVVEYIDLSSNVVKAYGKQIIVSGANGNSIMARYSVNGASNWHGAYAEGDLYMSTSTDGGLTWSEAMRIVGEKGDGGAWTDYSFGISSLLETTSVQTPPNDIKYWHDAPVSTTSGKPYLWMRVQKYTDTDTTDGTPAYLRLTGEKGADGTSVNIKGYVSGWVGDIGQVITNDESLPWAIDDPHCIYIASTGEEREVKDGEGYLIKAYELDGETDNEGHLIVSSAGKWLDCGKITGEKGDDGKTMYLHIAYSNSADGSKDFTTDDDGGKTRSYMGTYTDFLKADSTDYKKYYWKPYKGEKGDDGESALYITITPEGDTFPADADGRAEKSSEHTVTARLYYGTVAQEDWAAEVCTADDADWYTAETLKNMSGDIEVNSIRKSGADCVVSYTVGESSWVDDNAYIVIRLKNKYGTVERQVNCFAQRRGDKGTRGAVLRGPQDWNDAAVGYAFQSGDEGEEFKDIVIYGGYYYSCIKSHTKTEENFPLSTADTNNGYWKLEDRFEMVATKILLAQYALVKNLGVESIEMKDSAGNVVFRAKDGEVTCNSGNFKDVNVSGNSVFSGMLNAVSGSFKALQCVNSEGKVTGSITFGGDGNIDFNGEMRFNSGDLYHQGEINGRNLRLFGQDIYARGLFGHCGKVVAVVRDNYMDVYIKQNSLECVSVQLSTGVYDNNRLYYKIPLYGSKAASGTPIDVVVIHNSMNDFHYAFTGLSMGKEWSIINGNDTLNEVFFADTAGWHQLKGGSSVNCVYIAPDVLYPIPTSIGKGVFRRGETDLDWH